MIKKVYYDAQFVARKFNFDFWLTLMITTGDIVGTNVDEKVLDKDAAIFSLERQMGEARIILHTINA